MKLVKCSVLLANSVTLVYAQLQQTVISTDEITAADLERDALIANEIIPQVLDDFEPSYNLDVIYPGYESVNLGNTVPVKHVAQKPVFTIIKLDTTPPESSSSTREARAFTLILTDPDAKSRNNPKWSEMCHWIVTNITAFAEASLINTMMPTMLQDALIELVDYQAPSPPKKTGPHRYVFVLLEGDIDKKINPPKERKHWGYDKVRHGVRDWAAENDLTVVGANFFHAQHKEQ